VGWVGGGLAAVRRGAVSRAMIHVSDVYPTIVHGIAGLEVGVEADGEPPLDGVDAWPSIIGRRFRTPGNAAAAERGQPGAASRQVQGDRRVGWRPAEGRFRVLQPRRQILLQPKMLPVRPHRSVQLAEEHDAVGNDSCRPMVTWPGITSRRSRQRHLATTAGYRHRRLASFLSHRPGYLRQTLPLRT
jgi:hypothetical protein